MSRHNDELVWCRHVTMTNLFDDDSSFCLSCHDDESSFVCHVTMTNQVFVCHVTMTNLFGGVMLWRWRINFMFVMLWRWRISFLFVMLWRWRINFLFVMLWRSRSAAGPASWGRRSLTEARCPLQGRPGSSPWCENCSENEKHMV